MSDKPIPVLDSAVRPEVKYCIPNWLRDEQVRHSTARFKGRIEEVTTTREDPIAIVCFGPSLNETWEQIRDYPYVMTCSGAHKFLVDRGIIPTWHVEVDPREHKIQLLGTPTTETIYLPASACHPKYFDHLERHGAQIKLWHVFSNEEEALRILPPQEWALTGGSSVGLRCMTIARFFGFVNHHVFGMDGNEGPSGKHADTHPSQPKGYALTIYDGVEYKTTPSMLCCAQETFHELDMMPDVTATFYGNGLVQHMAKHYVKNPIVGASLGLSKPELISAEYRAMNAALHASNLFYGAGGGKHAETVQQLITQTGAESVLDYGCGKGYLGKALSRPIWEYDPAFPDKATPPRPADLVVCTDVLEHIEPEKLGAVLSDLKRCVKQVGFFVIHMGASQKTLPDGRNTHLIQRGQKWWAQILAKIFAVNFMRRVGPELYVIVSPKPKG